MLFATESFECSSSIMALRRLRPVLYFLNLPRIKNLHVHARHVTDSSFRGSSFLHENMCQFLPDALSRTAVCQSRSFTVDLSAIEAHGAEASGLGTKDFGLWPGLYRSPVTAALWSIRSKIAAKVLENGHSPAVLSGKRPDESRTSVVYPFTTDAVLREAYRSPWNHCRIGKLLEDLDALAGTIAMKHCMENSDATNPLLLVTASVDKISLKKPIRLDADLKLAGAVAWTGRSSMQIRMQVIQPASGDQSEEFASLVANFTFVARDARTKHAAPVNPLLPQTEEEKSLFLKGEEENTRRKQLKSQKIAVNSAEAQQNGEKAKRLLAEGRILIEMPALADRYSVLMKDTRLENALICQPQQRNLHGRIFGGFLMRRAFELAFGTCYVFGGERPIFQDVDHVDFHRPVDVGDLLRFKSCVLYTETENVEKPLIHVEVAAFVAQPESRSSELSNTFYFTFTLDPEKIKAERIQICRVLPGSEEEARRQLARYNEDH